MILVLENKHKIVVLILCCTKIKAQQFNTDLHPYQQCLLLQKIVEFKDFSRLLSDFPVLFKAYIIFKDFQESPLLFKPVRTLSLNFSKKLYTI